MEITMSTALPTLAPLSSPPCDVEEKHTQRLAEEIWAAVRDAREHGVLRFAHYTELLPVLGVNYGPQPLGREGVAAYLAHAVSESDPTTQHILVACPSSLLLMEVSTERGAITNLTEILNETALRDVLDRLGRVGNLLATGTLQQMQTRADKALAPVIARAAALRKMRRRLDEGLDNLTTVT
jgi:hypothetical protein